MPKIHSVLSGSSDCKPGGSHEIWITVVNILKKPSLTVDMTEGNPIG